MIKVSNPDNTNTLRFDYKQERFYYKQHLKQSTKIKDNKGVTVYKAPSYVVL